MLIVVDILDMANSGFLGEDLVGFTNTVLAKLGMWGSE